MNEGHFLEIVTFIGLIVYFLVFLAGAIIVVGLVAGGLQWVFRFLKIRITGHYYHCGECGQKIWGKGDRVDWAINHEVAKGWKGVEGLLVFLSHPRRCVIPKLYRSIYERLWKESHEEIGFSNSKDEG